MPFSNQEIAHHMWVFTGGAILVLLMSILSGIKRNWFSLLVGCAIGGLGSSVAGQIWSDSPYIFLICGVAAVAAENFLAGAINASKQFADSPIKVISHFGKMFLPTLGKTVGTATVDGDLK